LRFHLALGEPTAALDQAVSERRFAMIDVGDDREIADVVQKREKKGAEGALSMSSLAAKPRILAEFKQVST
jgi:hypothetical protein